MGGGEGYRSVAYFVNWAIYGRKHFPWELPVKELTHVLYAFGDNRDTGEVFLTDPWADVDIHWQDRGDSWNDTGKNLYGCLKQLNLLKKDNRNLKVLLSVGGWTYTHEAKHMDGPASTPAGRKTFADSCVQLIKDHGFDGIDVDWEYPQNGEQGEQYVLLLQEIRQAMDAYATALAEHHHLHHGEYIKPHFDLSIAAPAGQSNYRHLPLGRIAEVVDFINLMAYDYAGSWDHCAGHQSNLYPSHSNTSCTPFNTHSVVHHYLNSGVTARKLVLGMPLYGRAFVGTSGPGRPYNGGCGEGSFERGVWDFKSLPRPGAKECIDEEAGASYSFDEGCETMVSYDNVEMGRRKAQWIKEHGLGGAMWWESSGDKKGEESMICNVVQELGPGKLEQCPNWLHYPDSKYDNLRQGFPDQCISAR
ncbi:putative chitinase [Delitschia confertaspora ATCC 74209]|uniref:chitinase n=1 Tax=Delitschia confertaspora ATCC 74209 TaxID=1513339 RepID=A0A9P4JCZ5_9PLEO|nr:putative chitinase [Delitschia confertaspora ATCC 74209]